MIIVKLQGGLGNQMFQYAFGRVVSDKLQTKLLLDLSWFDSQTENVVRKFELNCFDITPKTATSADVLRVKAFYMYPFYLFPKKLQMFLHVVSRKFVVRENHLDLQSIDKFSRNADYYFDGYWQSESYLKMSEQLIREELNFVDTKNKSVIDWLSKISTCNAVSLHIRRGDYVSNPKATAYHGVMTLEYYQNAIKSISNHVDNPVFFVFSDDLLWAKDNLKTKYVTHYVSHTGNDSDDMCLMSKCRHHIIANSSFSWWGAWLNSSKKKLVIAPRIWFKDAPEPQQLIPSNWMRI